MEALEAAKGLLGCWRTGEANEPTIFIAAIAAVLQLYSHEVVQYICDPRCGMPFTNKWPPTSPHEVKEVCDLRADIIFGHEEMARRAENERLIDQGVSPKFIAPPEPVKPTREEMEAKHGKNWGINNLMPNEGQRREFAKTLPVGSKWTEKTFLEAWRAQILAGGETREDGSAAPQAMHGQDLVDHYAAHDLGNTPKGSRPPARMLDPAMAAADDRPPAPIIIDGVEVDQGAAF